MPLTIRLRSGRSCPTITCDHCGRAITDADDGNAQWAMDNPDAEPVFTHKRCCCAFEAARPGVPWGAQELSAFLFFLTHNLKLDAKRAKRVANMLESISNE